VSGAGLERRVEHLEDACYAELSPLERFRLSLEAGARDDFEAADRLCGACPTRTYRQADAAFSGRVRAAELICLVVYADLNYLLGRLRTAEAIGETLPGLIEDAMTNGYFAGYAGAGGNIADLDDETADESIETDDRLHHARSERVREAIGSELARHAASIWQGFCLFAREEVEVEPEVLARSFMPPLADMQAAIADVQGDEEGVRECHEALSMLWEQRLELYGATVAVG
jgi:hypothetical protein